MRLSVEGLKGLWSDLGTPRGRAVVCSTVLGVTLAGAGRCYMQWYILRQRELRRPHVIKELSAGETVEDPAAELTLIMNWLQDSIVRPLDARLPGQPFTPDLLAFPFTPMVLVIGNHSAGKSTFINRMLGVQVQETGVAPTDDGFTVLQRHPHQSEVEDGPTLLSCDENRHFKELQRFGPGFWSHLRRKLLVLPEDAAMPYGLQIVDTPGMIDMPVKSHGSGGGRGYSFLQVVRWFAQRADLVLLLFDPDKPGTTGESLDVLTQSLAGLDHKFLIVLNKVDQLENSLDFARAYGTLGWALSKVIPRKDIPLIYTMYNADASNPKEKEKAKEHKLPLEPFRKKQEEVIAEVLRAKVRHWDGCITTTEETLRELALVTTVSQAVREKARSRRAAALSYGSLALGAPGIMAAWALHWQKLWTGSKWMLAGFWGTYTLIVHSTLRFLYDHCRQSEGLQLANIDTVFEERHKEHFIHADDDDLRARWSKVRPRTLSILNNMESVANLPLIAKWEIDRISSCLTQDFPYLRKLAKISRAVSQRNGGGNPKQA